MKKDFLVYCRGYQLPMGSIKLVQLLGQVCMANVIYIINTGCPKKHGNSVTNWISSLL